jgi:hypothetical protein
VRLARPNQTHSQVHLPHVDWTIVHWARLALPTLPTTSTSSFPTLSSIIIRGLVTIVVICFVVVFVVAVVVVVAIRIRVWRVCVVIGGRVSVRIAHSVCVIVVIVRLLGCFLLAFDIAVVVNLREQLAIDTTQINKGEMA